MLEADAARVLLNALGEAVLDDARSDAGTELMLGLARHQREAGQVERAEALLDEVLSSVDRADAGPAHLERSILLWSGGHTEEALAQCRLALRRAVSSAGKVAEGGLGCGSWPPLERASSAWSEPTTCWPKIFAVA